MSVVEKGKKHHSKSHYLEIIAPNIWHAYNS